MVTTVTASGIQERRTQQTRRVRPSIVDPATAAPFTLDQELKPFATWVGDPLWVPPKNSSKEMAESMLRHCRLHWSHAHCWNEIVDRHRDSFTQVREIELTKASIRLPKGSLFVSVTERRHFDRITDNVPKCVQTRLEEFLAGPGRKPGVRVSYLKPLCVELDNQLLFTTRSSIDSAIAEIQSEVFAEYHRRYLPERCKRVLLSAVQGGLAIPRAISTHFAQRRKKALDAFQAKLEFERRKTALRATKAHHSCKVFGCTFDEMLELTNPLQRAAVIEQYAIERQLTRGEQARLAQLAAGYWPWFVTFSMSLGYTTAISLAMISPLAFCDPAFVAEFPDSPGVLMNIGHFDEIAGVQHVEF